jgi:hypothetical protein
MVLGATTLTQGATGAVTGVVQAGSGQPITGAPVVRMAGSPLPAYRCDP